MMINPAIQQSISSGRLADTGLTKPSIGTGGGDEQDFGKMLVSALEEVNDAQLTSRETQQDFLSGRRPVELHELAIASEKASTSMQLTLAVRNKALEAFQEINRLPI